MNIVLVPLMGAKGAALATGLANLFVVLFYYYFVNKLDNIRYEDKKIINAITLTIIIAAISLSIANLNIYYRLPIKVILFASFPLILYSSGYYDKEEIHQIKHALGELKSKYMK